LHISASIPCFVFLLRSIGQSDYISHYADEIAIDRMLINNTKFIKRDVSSSSLFFSEPIEQFFVMDL